MSWITGGSEACMREPSPRKSGLPSRLALPSLPQFALYLMCVLLFTVSVNGVGVSPGDLVTGIPHMGRILSEMVPPDLNRLQAMARALVETFQMALVGAVFGVAMSVPLAIFASRTHTPHPLLYHAARLLVSLFRTVPDLVWALFFVASVGLGPFAGALAIMIDTVGFCGRFFAEAMEEVDRGPQEALGALGAGRQAIVVCAVLPAALPSFINTSLFSLEKGTRASVVLGLVGAGGIGIELKAAMDMFRYDQAATTILMILALVVVVEHISTAIRRRVM